MSGNIVKINGIQAGAGDLLFIAGPCVIESRESAYEIASALKELAGRHHVQLVFKASYDKANRTSIDSFRGPGIGKGLDTLGLIREKLGLKVLSDVHRIGEIAAAAEVLDIIQIPAFLCRQTDFLLEVAKTGKPVNVKKGQFLAPWDMENVVRKIKSVGNDRILLTERGTMFGYNNLVVDFRGIDVMRQTGCPVIFDATHSVQLPGGAGNSSAGERRYAPVLARAAVAAGADGVFMEVHPDPDNALCDGPNSLHPDTLDKLIPQLVAIKGIVKNGNIG